MGRSSERSRLGIHTTESYLIVPLLQRRLTLVPPALMLISILINQLVFGLVEIGLPLPSRS